MPKTPILEWDEETDRVSICGSDINDADDVAEANQTLDFLIKQERANERKLVFRDIKEFLKSKYATRIKKLK